MKAVEMYGPSQLAEEICVKAHKGQVDKGGSEYYLHPFAVAEMCETEDEKIVALLHDVLEDSDIRVEDLSAAGFGEAIVSAVGALTRRQNEIYGDCIQRVKRNPLAKAVKLRDLRHNSDLSRLKAVTDEDIKRAKKYRRYMKYLKAPDE